MDRRKQEFRTVSGKHGACLKKKQKNKGEKSMLGSYGQSKHFAQANCDQVTQVLLNSNHPDADICIFLFVLDSPAVFAFIYAFTSQT